MMVLINLWLHYISAGNMLTNDIEIDCGALAKDTEGTKRVHKETHAAMSYTLGPERFSGPPPKMSRIMEAYCDVVTTIQAYCSEGEFYPSMLT